MIEVLDDRSKMMEIRSWMCTDDKVTDTVPSQ